MEVTETHSHRKQTHKKLTGGGRVKWHWEGSKCKDDAGKLCNESDASPRASGSSSTQSTAGDFFNRFASGRKIYVYKTCARCKKIRPLSTSQHAGKRASGHARKNLGTPKSD